MIRHGGSKLVDKKETSGGATASQLASIAVERPDQQLTDVVRFVG
jgi:hypothetical protein